MTPSLQSITTYGGYGLAVVLLAALFHQHTQVELLEKQLAATTPIPVSAALPTAAPTLEASFTKNVKLQDARTQELLDDLADIAAAARPGEVNQRFQDKAWDVLLDSDFERRTRNFGLLLGVLRPEDGVALHVLFNKMHQAGRDYADEYARFATQWGKVDGPGALGYYLGPDCKAPTPFDVENAIKGWGEKNSQQALTWALENRASVQGRTHAAFGPLHDPVASALRGWARVDPEGAMIAMQAQFPKPEERIGPAMNILIESLFGKGWEPTIELMKRLPDSDKVNNPACEFFVADVFRRLRDAGTPTESVAQNFLKLADQPWISLNTLENFTGNLFRDRAEAIASELTTPAAKPVMQGKFASWSTQNPDQVGEWLNNNKGSALYDLGAAELARSLLTSDPGAAATWAGTIKDAALRTRVNK